MHKKKLGCQKKKKTMDYIFRVQCCLVQSKKGTTYSTNIKRDKKKKK